ncbi:MAG: zinc-ribbon domain-containing protein, partial [Deltaproteobacteria bacterium]
MSLLRRPARTGGARRRERPGRRDPERTRSGWRRVICSSCQRENPAQANFCMQCGAPLAASELPERDPRV